MSNAKISVIVPIYNTEKYLKRCVDSILKQTHQNIEIILVDDGSTDACPLICDEYAQADDRVKVIHKSNGGLSSARNAGIDLASGEYIGFVDSDDYVSANMYELLLSRLLADGTQVSNCMYVRFDDSNEYEPRCMRNVDTVISSEDFVSELMMHKGDVSVCTKLFVRELFDSVRFECDRLNEDLLFIMDVLSQVSSISFVGKVGYNYYIRESSMSSGYGKAVVDMVGNALVAKTKVEKSFPNLLQKATRFAIYQHMAYLLLVPRCEAIKTNKVYQNALKYVRSNLVKSIFNKYLSFKNKITVLSLAVFPKSIARMYQNKRKK